MAYIVVFDIEGKLNFKLLTIYAL